MAISQYEVYLERAGPCVCVRDRLKADMARELNSAWGEQVWATMGCCVCGGGGQGGVTCCWRAVREDMRACMGVG